MAPCPASLRRLPGTLPRPDLLVMPLIGRRERCATRVFSAATAYLEGQSDRRSRIQLGVRVFDYEVRCHALQGLHQ